MSRFELKYILNNNNDIILEKALEGMLLKDPYCIDSKNYLVTSLYFDDFFDTSFYEVEAGLSEKTKYRIRYYNNDNDKYKLEIKRKRSNVVFKDSVIIGKDVVEKILIGDVGNLIYGTENQILKKFLLCMQTKFLRPKVIVSYERVPFILKENNIRITFDRKLTASLDFNNFTNGNFIRFPFYDKVIEIKFDDFLPKFVKKIVAEHNILQSTFSKYYNARLKSFNLGDFKNIWNI